MKRTTDKTDVPEGYIALRASVCKEDITLVNIYVPCTGAPKYIKLMFIPLKGETQDSRGRGRRFPMDTSGLNYTERSILLYAPEPTLFSRASGMNSRTDPMRPQGKSQ